VSIPRITPANRSMLYDRRRRTLGLIAVIVVSAAVAGLLGFLLGPTVRSPAQATADAAPPAASPVTATVVRRTLADTVTVRGRVVPGTSVKLTTPDDSGGAPRVVTAVRVKKGQPLREGAVFLEISGEPLFGLVLPFRLYRDLTPGSSGPDVEQVQRALRRLGSRTVVNGVLDTATQEALADFYAQRGYRSPAAAGGPVLPRADVVRLDRSGRAVSAIGVAVGSELTSAGSTLVELDAGPPTVRAMLPPEQRALVRSGSPVDVTDDVRGDQTKGMVRRIASQVTESEQGDGFEVVVAFIAKPLAPTPNHTVMLRIHGTDGRGPVLAVPVTAIYAHPDGTTFVTVVHDRRSGRDETNDVVVSVGRTVDGWVEVQPPKATAEPGRNRLDVGDAVLVGIREGD
jgi:multidrug efflux pump subunit AcrA (membrane-fusion protein)